MKVIELIEEKLLSETLNLSADDVLTTTRSVRKRLDLTRPVEREVIEDCLRLAQQAPAASNKQHWHFIVVTDAEKRWQLGEIYRNGLRDFRNSNLPTQLEGLGRSNPDPDQLREASDYLSGHIHKVPVHVIPCFEGRSDSAPVIIQSAHWGTITPAAWSFMLACRCRGLGSVWTSFHLYYEREAAEVLGIPFEQVTQAALIPVAYTIGTDFKPAKREPLETMLHWDEW